MWGGAQTGGVQGGTPDPEPHSFPRAQKVGAANLDARSNPGGRGPTVAALQGEETESQGLKDPAGQALTEVRNQRPEYACHRFVSH